MGVGLVRKGASGSVSHSQATPTLALRDTYGATFSFIQNGNLSLRTTSSNPSIPSSGELTFFAKERASKIIPSVIGPSGFDYNIQAALWGSTNIRWVPGATTLASISWGNIWFPRNNGGAQSHPAKSATNAMTSMNKAVFSTTTTANSSSGIQTTNTAAWIGNAVGLGGFFFFARFGMTNNSLFTGVRVLVGLSILNNVLSVDPSTINGTIGIIKDGADTTWHFLARNLGGTFTKQNTFVTVTRDQILDIYIHIAPNGGVLSFHLRDAVAGTLLASSSFLAGLGSVPDNTLFLYIHSHVQTTVAGTVAALALAQMYLESDL